MDFYIEHVTFYHRPLNLYRESYGACMCIPDLVITMDSDGMGHCTRVYVIGCV
jgi:hypothetical protein